jgi:glycosyltransferase involved in cell wall biosynthesis
MEENKQTYIGKKLVIISHTEHFLDAGVVKGWAPTITEIEYLATIFEHVIHAAPIYENAGPSSIISYKKSNITYVPLIPSGGMGLKKKFQVILTSLKNLCIIHKILKDADFFQFRAPTGMGVILIPYLTLFSGRRGWFKYAGNWMEANAPLSYKFQRFWFSNLTKIPVTINGKWLNQKKHLFTFDNPCLTQEDILDGNTNAATKTFNDKINFIFIGKLVDSKGVQRILDAFALIPKDHPRLGRLILIGDGPNISHYQDFVSNQGINADFKGFMLKGQINSELLLAHVLLLPSDSEGFPKVVAEGLNFSCIPIVSNVSCVDQYIHNEVNGLLLAQNNKQLLMEAILWILNQPPVKLVKMAKEGRRNIEKFTYKSYLDCIKVLIFHLK